MEIDVLDAQLIDLLMQDANVSSSKLAKQLNIHSSTVRRRMKTLIEQGVIRIVARPSLDKIGLPVTAFISFEVSHEKLNSVLKELSKSTRVAWVGATSGLFNIRTVWWVSSTEELYRIMENEIAKIPGILRIETSICLQTEKQYPIQLKRIIP